jgi:hypothetical protein
VHDLARNKATAIAFYELTFNERRPREAIERLRRRRAHPA